MSQVRVQDIGVIAAVTGRIVGRSSYKCHRVKVGGSHPEDLFGLSGLRRYFGVWGAWSGQAPDDSRLYARDVSTQDIHALDVELP
jgi:hypothetical protein